MSAPASAPEASRFRGWPAEALEFFEGLEAENSKAYWTANRERYDRAVRAPMDALADELEGEFGRLQVFRPYRDVRFSRDKRPYKTAIGAVTEGELGEMYYVQVSTEGLLAASGQYQMARDQLERHRAAVDDDEAGAELEGIVASLEADGYTVGAHDQLKSAPRGFPRDHPRIRLLRLKGLMASRTFEPGPWLDSRTALDRVVATWRGCRPLNHWLATHVGPSQLPPPEFG